MAPESRRPDGWISGALVVLAFAFAYGGKAPLLASGGLLLAGALAWLARRGARAPLADPARANGRELSPPR